jgi:hypothetical protein
LLFLFLLFFYLKDASSNDDFYFSGCVTVEQFLTSLIGKETFSAIKQKPSEQFLRGLVSFTHFIKKLDNLAYEDARVDFLGRCAAGQFRYAHQAFDLFIPVMLENGELTYIFIQVKNTERVDNSAAKLVGGQSSYVDKLYFKDKKVLEFYSIFMDLKTTKSKLAKCESNKPTTSSSTLIGKNAWILIRGLSFYQNLTVYARDKLSFILDCARCVLSFDKVKTTELDEKTIRKISSSGIISKKHDQDFSNFSESSDDHQD